jgi:hypothetical protein
LSVYDRILSGSVATTTKSVETCHKSIGSKIYKTKPNLEGLVTLFPKINKLKKKSFYEEKKKNKNKEILYSCEFLFYSEEQYIYVIYSRFSWKFELINCFLLYYFFSQNAVRFSPTGVKPVFRLQNITGFLPNIFYLFSIPYESLNDDKKQAR